MMGLMKSEIKENIITLILLSLWSIFESKVENSCPVNIITKCKPNI